jgi:hypothetical protein
LSYSKLHLDGKSRVALIWDRTESGPTTYDYYDDGTLKSAIDARGAKGEYGYFPRKLMRIAQYTATANACPADYSYGSDCVAPTPTVTFSYDEVGNRTLMDDGPGKVVYGYDMASRLIEEKRYFDDVNNPNTSVPPDESGRRPFIVGYAYHNSGLLKKVTDPYGSEIQYNYYKTGKLSSVTGTPFAGTSQYASNITYRAWGAPKQVNYGDGYAAAMRYNASLQLTEFDIPGISNQYGYHSGIGGAYTYFPDGRVSTIKAQTTTNSQYDRLQDKAFTYDHMGRIKTVRSAQNAGLGATGPFQFKQDYDYDEFGNMTKRGGWFWEVGQYDQYSNYGPDTLVTGEFNAAYVNNRATQANDFQNISGTPQTVVPKAQTWEYDPMGKLKKITTTNSQGQPIATALNTFDVLGHSKPGPSGPINLDGEGRDVGAGVFDAKVMVRSTVLGGEALTAIHANGNKLVTFVYVEGHLLAEQEVWSATFPNPQYDSVVWHHRDPLNAMSMDISRKPGQTSSQNDDNGVQYAVDPAGTMVRVAGAAVQNLGYYPGQGQTWTSFYQPGVGTTVAASNPAPGNVGWDCSDRLVNGGTCGGQISTSQDMREGMGRYEAYVRTKTASPQGFNGSDNLLPANYSPGIGGSPLGTYIRREAWTGIKIFDEVDVGLDSVFWEFVPGGDPSQGQQGAGRGRESENLETNEGIRGESCVVTLVARKINFKDTFLKCFDSHIKEYHLFVTTGPKKGEWEWLYHGWPSDGQLVTTSLRWDTSIANRQNWDREDWENYGGFAVDETVPRSCDMIKSNFDDILNSINKANIKYNMTKGPNSNSAIATMLFDYDRDLQNRLWNQLNKSMGPSWGYLLTGLPRIPAWGVIKH